jgi:diguanylate cyclase (GGDEF)-like protein
MRLRLSSGNRLILTLGAILVAGFLAVNLYSLRVSSDALRELLIRNTLPLTSNNIYSDIQESLLRPIYIASLMAHDTFLIDWMTSGERDPEQVKRYLQAIQKKYDVFSAFVVSDLSQHYYHFDGILKTVSSTSQKDQWFFSMRSHPSPYRVDIDTNEAAKHRLTIFINHKIQDHDGRYLGITGLGLEVATMSSLIAEYKERYDRNIFFVNRRGIVQSHVQRGLIGTVDINEREGIRAVAEQILSGDQGSLRYTGSDGTVFVRYRYIPELDWVLIVEQPERSALASLRTAFYRNLAVGASITLIVLLISAVSVRRFQTRLERMATTDTLSGLYNRESFETLYKQAIAHAERHQRPLSLLMFDIDRFKHINDQHGHLAGDAVIKQVASLAKGRHRGVDLVVRWGGDEFVMLLSDCPIADAQRLAEALCHDARESIDVPGCNRAVTLSIGVVAYHPGDTLDELLARADVLLYQAKAAGRDQVVAAP